MTKRIIAILTALLMVFSALLFAGCSEESEGDSDPTGKNLSAKELFKVSLLNTALGENADIVSSLSNSKKSLKGTLSAEINALEIEGASVLPENKPIKASFNIETDDKQNVKLGLDAELLGEKPSAEILLIDNVIYFTDVLGLNDKAIKLDINALNGTAMEEGASTDGMADSAVATPAWAEKLPELTGIATEVLIEAINANVTDSAFVEETKDVTIGGKEIKGARIITFTISPDLIKGIVKDFINKSVKNEDLAGIIKEFFPGEIDADTAADELVKGFGSIKIVNTTYNKDTVALEVVASDDKAPVFKFEGTFVDDNVSFKLAPTTKEGDYDESQGIASFDRTVENGKEKIVLSFKEDGKVYDILTFEGTYANGKHDGTLKINADGEEIAVKLSLETGKGKFKLAVSEVSYAGQTLKFDFIIDSTFSSTKENITISFKADQLIMGLGKIDVKFAIAAETTNVNISAPSNSVSIEELDKNTVAAWMTDITTKFPKIMEYVSNLYYQQNNFGSSVELPDDDFDFNYDEDYDYDFDYEDGDF